MSTSPNAPFQLNKSARARRIAIGAGVVALWAVGLLMMARRNANRSEVEQLADVALRVQPATFYYAVERNGQQIGALSSAIDTTAQALLSHEYFLGESPLQRASAPERASARWQTTLSRGFRLQRTTIAITRANTAFSIRAAVAEDTTLVVAISREGRNNVPVNLSVAPPVFTPVLATVAFMLGGPHEIGRAQTMSVFDPTTRTVLRPELKIHAESLFTVVDSAAVGPSGGWIAAHRDTVRAWRIEGGPAGLSAWVDAEGRVVSAKMDNGLSVMRTAFELAYRLSQNR
ncbi:MAG TPA: hypothetical protein VFS56_07155 [Gemmatimonadaceae bacterium]|nr:hypothetical protein [Gemmatimonadaceae bacterium]